VIIVDGYNLVHALKRRYYDMPGDFFAARARTLDLLESYALAHEARVLVFLDGTPGRGPDNDAARPHIRLIYTGGEADSAICKHVRTAAMLNDVTVVSSDREVADQCRLYGASTLKSEAMAKKLEPHLKRMLNGASAGAYVRKDANTQVKLNGLPPAPAQPIPHKTPAQPVKPALSRGAMSDYELEMLDAIEDFDELVEEALEAPLPKVRQPEELSKIVRKATKKRR